jgi:HEAT repeat protein
MRNRTRSLGGFHRVGVTLLVALIFSAAPPNLAAAQDDQETVVTIPAGATVESLFKDFLHYARIGRFTMADAYAKALLEHPDLDPVTVLEVASKDRDSVKTLLTIIENSTIGERAARVLKLIQQGEFEKRRDKERIRANITRLAGDPQQEHFAKQHLIDSGEYAAPELVQTLLDDTKKDLWPRVVMALPQMGKGMVNPFVQALRMTDDDVRLHIIKALGEIGYHQAVPYLQMLIADENLPDSTKVAARQAIDRIQVVSGRPIEGGCAEQFYKLAVKYYNEDASVRADARLDSANVWYWDSDSQALTPIVVPRRLFGPVMAMRCCQEALTQQADKAEANALWLAANIRREDRLGLNVESGDPDEMGEPDPTRLENFPRALYFTQAAGPLYAHMVLERAVADRDAAVALGAIEALRITAGETSLVGTEDYKQPLVQALQFPNLKVRTRAALALGAALPKSPFAGSHLVVPVLANALSLEGTPEILVIDANESDLNRLMDELRGTGARVIGEKSFYTGISRAREEFRALSAIFISTDIADPGLVAAMNALRSEFAHAMVPVIIVAKPEQALLAEEVASLDEYADFINAGVGETELTAALDALNTRVGNQRLDPDLALSMALEAADTLRRIAEDGRTVFNFAQAEPALIGALTSPSQELQITCASVLALAPTRTAQRAIAHVAMDDANTETLRVSVFASLAESAKNHGNLLEDGQIIRLVEIGRDDEDLVIRTAASEALGAMNLKTSRASDIIRKYYNE